MFVIAEERESIGSMMVMGMRSHHDELHIMCTPDGCDDVMGDGSMMRA